MRNWLIAMAVSGTLMGLSNMASAQGIQRTGGGFAKSECFFSAGSCGSLGPAICTGPDCNASISGNGTGNSGVNGESQISMSAINISVSGSASFTPPESCSSPSPGGPGYSAAGDQSIYADVPNGTPIKITITASLSGSGGAGATWSDARSGIGGISTTTVFNALAGPGKITVSGVDYYFIDSIRASGSAVSRWNCTANNESFNGSLSMSFCVAAGKMKAASSPGLTAMVNTPVDIKVQVNNGCTNAPLSGQSISFSGADPAGGQNFSLPSSAQTDADGFATVSFTPGSTPGAYSIRAFCSACGANRQVIFTVTVLTNEEARALVKRFGDGSGSVGTRLENPLSVLVMNTVTGDSEPAGINVNFEPVGNCPGFSANPNFTATDEYGLARAFVSLPPEPGSCVYRASCESCLSNREVLFTVAAVVPPDIPIDQTPSGAGPSRSGGGPSTSSGGRGSGGSGPLAIEYNAIGPGFRLLSAPESLFIGILTEDPIRLRAFPREGSFQWSGPAGTWSQAEISMAFNQQFDATNPALETVTRTSDGKAVTARLIVQPRPSGDGEIAATLASLRELCIEADSPLNCLLLKTAHSEAYRWAGRMFEPHGRSGLSCGNNCCDAGKHMYWHAFITRFVGESYSIRHGDAHEKTNLDAFDPHNEIVMDLHNNIQGRAVGRTSTTEAEIELGVLARIRSGQALVLQNVANRDRQSLLEFSHICGQ